MFPLSQCEVKREGEGGGEQRGEVSGVVRGCVGLGVCGRGVSPGSPTPCVWGGRLRSKKGCG